MGTRTFSGRVEEGALALVDGLTRRDYGLSFGQYCGTVLVESIRATGELPVLPDAATPRERQRAAAFIKGFALKVRNRDVGRLDDAAIRDLMASRYE